MMITRIVCGILVLLVLTAGAALAWPGGPPSKVILSGPGLDGQFEVTEPSRLDGLGAGQLMDLERRPLPAPQVGEGYELHRFYKDEYGAEWDFDRILYYPNPAGGPGYVFYAEGIGYSPVHYAGLWFYATEQGDAAMQRLLKDLGALHSSSDASSTAYPAWRSMALVILGSGLVVGVGLLIFRQA